MIRKPASELGYSTDLWSGPRIRHLIKHEFKIKYHPKHMPRLMKNLGLELKFPERRAIEQDPKALREWKNKRFPEILKTAKKKHALLFYADEAIISLIPYVGKTWAFPNKKPIVRVSGKRGQNIGITAAVNQQGRMCFELTKEKERFTAKVFIRFIKKMRKEFPKRNIILIVDGAPTHTAGAAEKIPILTKEKERFTAKVFIRFIKKMRKEFPKRNIILIVDGAPTHTAGAVEKF